MDSSLYNVLKDGITAIDSSLVTDELLDKMSALYDEIEFFNPTYRLVGCDGRDIVIRHFLDCLAPVPLFRKYVKDSDSLLHSADLGSGSGLPGIPLALIFNNWSFDLVERMGRRAGFLRNALAMTGVQAKVVEKDLSQVNELYDVVTFRAFRQTNDILPDVVRITKCGSTVMAYKGKDYNVQQEINYIKSKYPDMFECFVEDYNVPMLDASRSMLILKRVK